MRYVTKKEPILTRSFTSRTCSFVGGVVDSAKVLALRGKCSKMTFHRGSVSSVSILKVGLAMADESESNRRHKHYEYNLTRQSPHLFILRDGGYEETVYLASQQG